MLKHFHPVLNPLIHPQPPLGGCVLKQEVASNQAGRAVQPPLGGCVLKQYIATEKNQLQSSRL